MRRLTFEAAALGWGWTLGWFGSGMAESEGPGQDGLCRTGTAICGRWYRSVAPAAGAALAGFDTDGLARRSWLGGALGIGAAVLQGVGLLMVAGGLAVETDELALVPLQMGSGGHTSLVPGARDADAGLLLVAPLWRRAVRSSRDADDVPRAALLLRRQRTQCA